jgi:hypothetical protein
LGMNPLFSHEDSQLSSTHESPIATIRLAPIRDCVHPKRRPSARFRTNYGTRIPCSVRAHYAEIRYQTWVQGCTRYVSERLAAPVIRVPSASNAAPDRGPADADVRSNRWDDPALAGSIPAPISVALHRIIFTTLHTAMRTAHLRKHSTPGQNDSGARQIERNKR